MPDLVGARLAPLGAVDPVFPRPQAKRYTLAMRTPWLSAVTVLWGAVLWGVGCNSDPEDSGNSNPDSGTESGTVSGLNPPEYINATLCVALVEGTATFSDCSLCCSNGTYNSAAFANEGRCVCGDIPPNTICADQTATAAACESCCDDAGATGHSWARDTSCTCSGGVRDSTTCPGNQEESSLGKACSYCCINHGFLGVEYLLGQCTCSNG